MPPYRIYAQLNENSSTLQAETVQELQILDQACCLQRHSGSRADILLAFNLRLTRLQRLIGEFGSLDGECKFEP